MASTVAGSIFWGLHQTGLASSSPGCLLPPFLSTIRDGGYTEKLGKHWTSEDITWGVISGKASVTSVGRIVSVWISRPRAKGVLPTVTAFDKQRVNFP